MADYGSLVQRFFEHLGKGQLEPSDFTDNFTASTTTSGQMEGSRYLGAGPLLAALFEDDFNYEIVSLTQEEDRAAAEVEGSGTFRDGTAYANSYCFMFHFQNGKIASVAEHFLAKPFEEGIGPRIKALMAQQK